MTLAPDVAELLATFSAAGVKQYNELSVLQARAVVESSRNLQGPKVEVSRVEDLELDGADGSLPARLYLPAGAEHRSPVMYLHGGGWVTGTVSVADRPCRLLAQRSGCAVVSVGYRLAPETRFPGPVEDSFAALTSLERTLPRYGLDPARLVIAGDSAGGTLAAATALLARDRGGPPIAHQLLMYPPLAPARDNRSASYRDYAEGYVLSRESMVWFWDRYLGPDQDGTEPYAAPLLTPDLRGLPPATVVTARYDPLLDDAKSYAERLRAAGVPVEYRSFDDQSHGFFWMAGALAGARELVEYLGHRLRDLDA